MIIKNRRSLLSNRGPYKIGKTIKCHRTKFKTYKLPLSVINNFYCGIIKVKVDANIYLFKKGEIYFLYPFNAKIINENKWNKVIEDINKDQEEHNKRMQYSVKNKQKKREKM